MRVRNRRTVSRAAAIGLAAALSIGSLAPPAGALTRLESRLVSMINNARDNNGLRELKVSTWLTRKARGHTSRMVRRGTLYHTRCLSCLFKARRYDKIGENVGVAATVRRVHRLMMRASGHRSNILGRGYHSIGVGVKMTRRGAWVTEIFWG
jgi:uncharacterized protein YkwD